MHRRSQVHPTPSRSSGKIPPQLERIPRYCLQRTSGQAVMYAGGQTYYLGLYGTPDSLTLYAQKVEIWRAGGSAALLDRKGMREHLTVMELVAGFLVWAKGRYVKSPQELSAFGVAIQRLIRLYRDTPVTKFGPVALQTVRSLMVADDLCRNSVNAAVHRIRRIWRWGTRNELLEETLWRALLSVPALTEGEEGVRESDPVQPAKWRQLRAVLRLAPATVQIMVRLQVLTGMRPGELVRLRAVDVDRSNKGWLYRPSEHKTKSRGKSRVIHIGPRARAILEPLLPAEAEAYVFRPLCSLEDLYAHRPYAGDRPAAHDPLRRRRQARARGVTPRHVGQRYSVEAYRRAVRRACEQAYPLPAHLARQDGESADAWRDRLGLDGWGQVAAWRKTHLLHPHQLRHSFATRIGNRYGQEAAQVLLGHSRLQTTGIYVQRDIRRGRAIIAHVG